MTAPNWFYDPMEVTRVEDVWGGHLEPPVDDNWSDLDRLRWWAGGVKADCGVHCHIIDYEDGTYGISMPGFSTSGYPLDQAWVLLNGICAGAQAVSR